MKNKFNIEMSGPLISKIDIRIVNDALKNGWYGDKKYYYVEKFEKEFAEYHGRKYGLMTPNCTLATHLLLTALGIKKGDSVINQDSTWVAPAAAVSYTGAKNIFCDNNIENWCLDHNSLQEKITNSTKAVITTALYGNMPDMDKIEKICKKNKLILIEDAAEGLGSKYKGRKVGSYGKASLFSFHRTKTLTTGEGGMMITSDKKLYERCKLLRDQGRDPFLTYQISELGFKYMPFNLQAALGYSQFIQIDKIVMQKRKIYHWYKKFFHDYDVKLNTDNEDMYNGCWATTLIIGDKYKINAKLLMNHLKNKNLSVRPFFCPLSKMKPFRQNNNNINAAYLFKNGITLPSALNLKKKEVQFYSECIKKFLDNHKK